MRKSVLVLALVALASSSFAQAQAALDEAVRKQPGLRYKGERVVEVTVAGKPVKLVEYVSRDKDRSRITYPSDSPRKGFIVVQDAKDRWEYNPGRNEVRRMPRRRGDTLMMLRGLSAGLREGKLKASMGSETVAGRKASVVKVFDLRGNQVQRLSIDESTGLVLKAEQFGPKERKLAGYEFAKVDYTPNFAAHEFEPPRPPGAKIVDRPPDFGVDWTVRTPSWLPTKFKEVGRGFRRLENRPVVMIHYSDGSKNFSIFQGRGARPPKFGREGEKPGFETVTRVFEGLWFVGLGRVEHATLDRVLKSIK